MEIPFEVIFSLIKESLVEALIVVDAAVPEERPPAAHALGALKANVDNCLFLFIARGAVQYLSLLALQ